MDSEKHDVFVSFQSDHVNEVRAVSERLMASGIDVWIDEYRILLDTRDHFESEYLKGVQHSRYAVVFASREWEKSPHCLSELQSMRNVFGDEFRQRVFVVFLEDVSADSEVLRILKDCERCISINLAEPKAINRVVEFVAGQLGQTPRQLERNATAREQRVALRYGVSIDIGSFLEDARFAINCMRNVPRWETYMFRGEIESHTCSILVSLSPNWRATNTLNQMVFSEESRPNDYQVRAQFAQYAEKWLAAESGNPKAIGLHRVLWNGRKHFALTFIRPATQQEGFIIERRYALATRDQAKDRRGEITVSIAVVIPSEVEAEAIASFRKCIPTIDYVVESLQHDPSVAKKSQGILPALVVNLGIVAFYLGAAHWIATDVGDIAAFRTAVVIIGISIAHTIIGAATPSIRWRAARFGRATSVGLEHTRWATRLGQLCVGHLRMMIDVSLAALVNPITWGVVAIVFWQRPDSFWIWGIAGAVAYASTALLRHISLGAVEAPQGVQDSKKSEV